MIHCGLIGIIGGSPLLLKSILLFLAFSLVAGCGPVYRQEGIQDKDPSKISVIEMLELCRNNECLILTEIDGKKRGIGWFERYEINPGVRNIKFRFDATGITSKKAVIVEFLAKPGKTYVAKANVSYAEMKWMPVILEKSSGKVISRVTGIVSKFD